MQQPSPVGRQSALRVPAQHGPPDPDPDPDPGPDPGPHAADPWLELEVLTDRLARLVLHAHALAERLLCISAPTPNQADRLRRLRAGAELARQALDALVSPSGTPAAPG